MLNAIDHVNADHIFIFPNNKNIVLAANQAASLVEDKDIIVIPTKTIPQYFRNDQLHSGAVPGGK